MIVTQMVSTHDALMRGVLHIPNLIKLNDIMNDFRYELEIYGMVCTCMYILDCYNPQSYSAIWVG